MMIGHGEMHLFGICRRHPVNMHQSIFIARTPHETNGKIDIRVPMSVKKDTLPKA